MKTDWSLRQQVIFDEVADHSLDAPHIAVRARAGSGKTTTGVEALKHTDPKSRVIAVAFNVEIARTLAERVPPHVEVRTLHSVGFGAIRANVGHCEIKADRIKQQARTLAPDDPASYHHALARVVSLAKGMMREPSCELAMRFGLDVPEPWTPAGEVFTAQAARLMAGSSRWTGEIDYDDMCWLPIVKRLPIVPYDFVFVDEAQDLNAVQHDMVKRLVGRRGRLMAIGDDRQAIYGFRGAKENSFDELANGFDARLFPLSVTYRCARQIVREANRLVPDLEAAPDAPEGVVRECSADEMLSAAGEGDFILSRTRAPLLGACLELLARGRSAIIIGRDIGENLKAAVRRSKAASLGELGAWARKSTTLAAEKFLPENQEAYAEVADTMACLIAMIPGASSVRDLIERLDYLFADGAGERAIRLSTVHKAKGLEAERVWLLCDTFCKRPGREEENLLYVGITRAKHELVMVRA